MEPKMVGLLVSRLVLKMVFQKVYNLESWMELKLALEGPLIV